MPRFFLILLLIYLAYLLVFRVIIPWRIRKFQKRMQDKFNEQQGYSRKEDTRKKRKEGSVHIDHVPGEKQGNKKEDEGEYVDYEEVDE